MEHINASLMTGSNLKIWDIEQITDASPVRETIINTQALSGIVIDITSDKSVVVQVTPLLSLDEDLSVGPIVTLGHIDLGGGVKRFTRTLIASPRLKVTVTKIESGDSTTYRNSTRGVIEDPGVQLENGAVPVVVQDQTSPTLILPMNRIDASTNLTANASIDDRSITVADATGFVDQTPLYIVNPDTNRYFHAHTVGAPVGNVLQLDTPLDSDFPLGVASEVLLARENMNVDGSGTTQVFTLRGGDPGLDLTIDITRIIVVCETNGVGDLSEFGDLPALVNGLVFRRVDGDTRNIFNAKTNGDFASYAYDFKNYLATNPQQGVNGFACRLTFAGSTKIGVALRIGPHDDIQALIQDDLRGLLSLKIILEGHEVV